MADETLALSDEDRGKAVAAMLPEIADFLPHGNPFDRETEAVAECCLAALLAAGFVILPPGEWGIDKYLDGFEREHRRIVGRWSPVETREGEL